MQTHPDPAELLTAMRSGDTRALDSLYREAKVEAVEYGETITVTAVCTPKVLGQVGEFIDKP